MKRAKAACPHFSLSYRINRLHSYRINGLHLLVSLLRATLFLKKLHGATAEHKASEKMVDRIIRPGASWIRAEGPCGRQGAPGDRYGSLYVWCRNPRVRTGDPQGGPFQALPSMYLERIRPSLPVHLVPPQERTSAKWVAERCRSARLLGTSSSLSLWTLGQKTSVSVKSLLRWKENGCSHTFHFRVISTAVFIHCTIKKNPCDLCVWPTACVSQTIDASLLDWGSRWDTSWVPLATQE